jgi:hypothetical protein
VGLFEPAEGGVWQLADYQARLIASFIAACASDPKRASWFRALKARAHPDIGHGIDWKDSPWHKFEIQHYRFRRYEAPVAAIRVGLRARRSNPAPCSSKRAAQAPTPSLLES